MNVIYVVKSNISFNVYSVYTLGNVSCQFLYNRSGEFNLPTTKQLHIIVAFRVRDCDY
jgi:hypothetical protein